MILRLLEKLSTIEKDVDYCLILSLRESTQSCMVCCDAFWVVLDWILMQKDQVIAYASKKLKVHKKNYPTHDLVLAAVVFSLKIWHHDSYGVYFDVFADYKSL